jgi:hypothetical protein
VVARCSTYHHTRLIPPMSTTAGPVPRPNTSAHSHSQSHSHTAPGSSVSDDARTFKLDLDETPPVDVGVLKELAKKGLVDALNSVRLILFHLIED